jgi:hypothetical protein
MQVSRWLADCISKRALTGSAAVVAEAGKVSLPGSPITKPLAANTGMTERRVIVLKFVSVIDGVTIWIRHNAGLPCRAKL